MSDRMVSSQADSALDSLVEIMKTCMNSSTAETDVYGNVTCGMGAPVHVHRFTHTTKACSLLVVFQCFFVRPSLDRFLLNVVTEAHER
ncbi:MAG: hypothetical protein A2289_20385 [Deltaproteobacteria bacterium RIFOXYA12_FULL_58_15]|nr:MAG: hypothetical protein A2289_20385 [Deltaproteobacteria bacterium RIFOXYA12_FULL_58_15]OGR14372.1 MAG: hypothetical protein A2341_25595 [Deltaproteobacteria bacterium RIFOXYB12_FULL_58_9]